MARHPYYCLDGRTPIACEADDPRRRAIMRPDNRRVALDRRPGILVSTVFTTFDEQAADDGPPLPFETRVAGGTSDGESETYATWAEAEAGHAEMVARVFGEEG